MIKPRKIRTISMIELQKRKIDALHKNSIATLVELAIVPRHLILSNNNVPKWQVTRYRGGSRCSRPFGKNRSILHLEKAAGASRNYPDSLFPGFESRDWRPTTEPTRGSNRVHGGPPSEDPAPFAMGGGGFARETRRTFRKKRRSSIVVRHSRRPFSVHCLAFVPCTCTPRLHRRCSASLSLSSTFHDVRAPPSSSQLFLRSLAFGFRSCLSLSLSLSAIEPIN